MIAETLSQPPLRTERRIARVTTTLPPAPGQFGPSHLAVEVLSPSDFAANDPFILLMDDQVDSRMLGGPHPHAGFETVTFVLEGSIRHQDSHGGAGVLGAGDVQWMTAGRGIIHDERVSAEGRTHALQLWLTLPKRDRWATPSYQDIHLGDVPVRREPGAEVRLYSGTSGALRSPTRNHVPVTLADIRLEAGATVEQDLPVSYNGFLYVLDGAALFGADGTPLKKGQVGWLDRPSGHGDSTVRITATGEPLRVLLYAGEPQNVPIVSYGPFIGDTSQDIERLFGEFRSGRFGSVPR